VYLKPGFEAVQKLTEIETDKQVLRNSGKKEKMQVE